MQEVSGVWTPRIHLLGEAGGGSNGRAAVEVSAGEVQERMWWPTLGTRLLYARMGPSVSSGSDRV